MKRLILVLALATSASAQVELALPTKNDRLFTGAPEEFYQFVDRNFKGVQSTPWEGGQFGFVRSPVETSQGVYFQQFHEGIDIKPLFRDAKGNPLDQVCAIADGTVVHTNSVSRHSNYGNFVVVQHDWAGCSYYSLYAHLSSIAVRKGEKIRSGAQLGLLGFTGAGIDQRRAHLHLELNLLISPDFEQWHRLTYPGDINRHGIYNGLNLAGIDIARLYQRLKQDPALTIPGFLAEEEPAFRVLLPTKKRPALLDNYPWLGQTKTKTSSWEITFNNSGLPLKITPSNLQTDEPKVVWIKESPLPAKILTRGLLDGSCRSAVLSVAGLNYMRLIVPKP